MPRVRVAFTLADAQQRVPTIGSQPIAEGLGLHGVLAFVVMRRTREIGIRIALGAQARNVIFLVVREMLLVILVGIAVGAAGGLLCGRYVESQLFGIKALDPSIFAISIATLLTASLTAALIPAWRASRLDPMLALRHE